MKILIRYHADIEPIEIRENGDWIDLRSAEDVELDAFEEYRISLGISVRLPDGYEAHIAPRSSTFSKWHILQTNSVGVVDNSYSGDGDIWMMPVVALSHTVIHKNDRIAQFRIMPKMPECTLEPVERLEGPDRGGFGSTGVR